MAKPMISSSIPILFLLLAFSLLVFSISVEGRVIDGQGLELECNKVYGVKNGDTCFAVEQTFKIPTERFNFINPNLNCSDLFIGQWVCLNGVLSLP